MHNLIIVLVEETGEISPVETKNGKQKLKTGRGPKSYFIKLLWNSWLTIHDGFPQAVCCIGASLQFYAYLKTYF